MVNAQCTVHNTTAYTAVHLLLVSIRHYQHLLFINYTMYTMYVIHHVHKITLKKTMSTHINTCTLSCTCTIHAVYSSPPLIRTPLLPRNFVLIREVSFGEREHHMHFQYLLPRICVLYRGVSSLESVL